MKITAILPALGGMLASKIQGLNAQLDTHECYAWNRSSVESRIDVVNMARDACYNNGRIFTGFYQPRQPKSMCPRTRTGVPNLYQVQNLNSGAGFDLGNDDCFDRLANAIALPSWRRR
jgi:hypothetical protein